MPLYETPVPGVERFPAEAARLQAARRLALEEHVGPLGERQQQLAAARPVDGQRDAALRGVEREPEERAVGIGRPAPEGRPPARRVALRRLDLHDVGAEVAEDLAGEEAGLVREVEDADAGEGVAQQAADASRPSREVSSSTARLPPVLGGPFARRPRCAKDAAP